MTAGQSDFICPACRSTVVTIADGHNCAACNRSFPTIFGIPDFRLRGDQYLSLEEEREKARKLHDHAQDHDFASLVSFYYSITDDVPEKLAPVFAGYVLKAPERSAPALKALAPEGGRSLLDLGCGSGGALVAARDTFSERTGVDIALRWLVIAQKRLQELGVDAKLVCAAAEALPFREGVFSHVMAADLLENARSPEVAVGAAASILEEGGRFYVSSSNGRWIGPHPATRIWAAGLLPERIRKPMLERRHGVDILRAVTFVSSGVVRRMAARAGMRRVMAAPLTVDKVRVEGRSAAFRSLAAAYSMLAKLPVSRMLLVAAGPVFESLFVKENAK